MKRLPLVLVVFVIICICACLIASLQMSGKGLDEFQSTSGFSNNGIPPAAAECSTINQFFPENPFTSWPLQWHECDWATITSYFCDPERTPAHAGIDIARGWTNDDITGAPAIATANSVVLEADYHEPFHPNWGMGNYVKLGGFEPICEHIVNMDLNGDLIIGEYCASICEEDINRDINNDGTVGGYCGEKSQWYATYMHLLDVAVQVGQIVHKGEVIGHIDSTGNSSGPHLHYQINGPNGAVDPGPALGCPDYQWEVYWYER